MMRKSLKKKKHLNRLHTFDSFTVHLEPVYFFGIQPFLFPLCKCNAMPKKWRKKIIYITRQTNKNNEAEKKKIIFVSGCTRGRYTLFSNPTYIEWIWLCHVWSGKVKSEIVSGNRYERAQTHSCKLTFYHVAAAGSHFFLRFSFDRRKQKKSTNSTRRIFKARIEKYTIFTHTHTHTPGSGAHKMNIEQRLGTDWAAPFTWHKKHKKIWNRNLENLWQIKCTFSPRSISLGRPFFFLVWRFKGKSRNEDERKELSEWEKVLGLLDDSGIGYHRIFSV